MNEQTKHQTSSDHDPGGGRIAELERTCQRLQHLYEISKLLTCFQSVERTVPDVVAVLARTLRLRNAILVLQTEGGPQLMTWQAEGEGAQSLQAAKDHAQAAYGYLVGASIPLGQAALGTFELPRITERSAAVDERHPKFVLLPFAENRAIFGALQIQGVRNPEKLDLVFVNAVVNQLAIALNRHAADQALRLTSAKLAGIISIAADAIISVDEASRIVMFNKGAERIFGWAAEEVLGKPLDILLPERFRGSHPGQVSAFARSPEAARAMGGARPGIFGQRKNGEEFPADAAISKLSVGSSWLLTVNLRDITDKRRIEREDKLLAEAAEVFAASLDTDKTLSCIAQLALREFGNFCLIEFVDEHGELRPLEVAVSDPARAPLAEALKRLPADRTRRTLSWGGFESKQPQLMAEVTPEALRAFAPGQEHLRLMEAIAPTSMMGVPLIVHGEFLGALTVAWCRPDRRYSAVDLGLWAKIGARAALALENARLYRTTQRAVRARDELLQVVAHDLRNPLGTVLLQAMLLGAQPERRAGKPGEVIVRAAQRMKRMIEDLLDVASMQTGQLSVAAARVRVGELVSESVESQRALAASHSLELELDLEPGLPLIWADRGRMLQVLENLIGNASKFTPPKGRITVGARRGSGEVVFSVEDTGVGIAAADLPRLFDRFWQLRKADHRGAGLGLSIVRGIVEAQGGRVWVESTEGRGSKFSFTVPVAPSTEDRPGQLPSAFH